MNESTGIIQKIIQINADKFIFNSSDYLVVLNKNTKELNYFNNDGIAMNEIPVCEFESDPIVFLDKNDKVLLYDIEKFVILSQDVDI